jgi:hypothetical protein
LRYCEVGFFVVAKQHLRTCAHTHTTNDDGDVVQASGSGTTGAILQQTFAVGWFGQKMGTTDEID